MELCDKALCTGCFACRNICPKEAIHIETDALGREIPYIDSTVCVSCSLCRKVCPVINLPKFNKAQCAYAVWSTVDSDKKKSSSGGAAAVLTRYILERGGIVFGSAAETGRVFHRVAENLVEAEAFRGSKYVQSAIGFCYKEVEVQLKQGKQVLFLGTPCQVAGLKGYLRSDPQNLVTIDLICHGTPPFRYLQEHLKKVKKWDKVSFRGEHDWYLTAYSGEKTVFQRNRECDIYFLAFLDGLTYRSNCYKCPFARPERVADLTIGDFWGLNRDTLKTQYDGRISLILSNTQKGEELFQSCREQFVWEKREFEEAINPLQGNLLHPSVPHPDREHFAAAYRDCGFEKAVQSTEIGARVKHNRKCLRRDRILNSKMLAPMRSLKHRLFKRAEKK